MAISVVGPSDVDRPKDRECYNECNNQCVGDTGNIKNNGCITKLLC